MTGYDGAVPAGRELEAAEVPTDVARRWLAERDEARKLLAETRDRRDYLQGQLDIIYDAEYSRNDALKRRIEKLTAAGDALAAAGRELYDSKTWSGKALTDARQAFIDAHAGWRSVRGDAPTTEGR